MFLVLDVEYLVDSKYRRTIARLFLFHSSIEYQRKSKIWL